MEQVTKLEASEDREPIEDHVDSSEPANKVDAPYLGDGSTSSHNAQGSIAMAKRVADAARAELSHGSSRRRDPLQPRGNVQHHQDSGATALARTAKQFSQALLRSEASRVDAKLLVDYQTILEGHCKYIPGLFSDTNGEFGTCLALGRELEAEATAKSGSGAMVAWSRHLKHENPTFSDTFNGVIRRLSEYFDVEVFACRLNFYRDGTDWKPFHHDSHAFGANGQKEDFTMGVSFGASRALAFLHPPSGSQFAFPQNDGDVFAFTSEANRRFQHGVPRAKSRHQGPRFSIIAWGQRRSLNERNAGSAERTATPPISQGRPPRPVDQQAGSADKSVRARQEQAASGQTFFLEDPKKANEQVDVSAVELIERFISRKSHSTRGRGRGSG